MSDSVRDVQDLLHYAAETHHAVYRIVDGVDADWASWYSDWLVEHSDLADLLASRPVRSELTWLLVQLDKDYAEHAPGEPWESWYATRIVAHFNQA